MRLQLRNLGVRRRRIRLPPRMASASDEAGWFRVLHMRSNIYCPADWYWYIRPRVTDVAHDQDGTRSEDRLGFKASI